MEGLTMKYFVLKPRSKTKDDVYAEASRAAMKTYAKYIWDVNTDLSDQLYEWVNKEHLKSLDCKGDD